MAITSGVWPDPVTSIEPTYWGVGSNVFALLGTYHQHGEQKHPFESWVKQLLQHPNEVLSFDDPRHWSERSFVALCMQTTDTSIELYWHDGCSSYVRGIPPKTSCKTAQKAMKAIRNDDNRNPRSLDFENELHF